MIIIDSESYLLSVKMLVAYLSYQGGTTVQFNDALQGYQTRFTTAKNDLATGHKDAGLRLLWALRHHLTQTPTADGGIQPFKKLLDNTVSLWGEGFDWD